MKGLTTRMQHFYIFESNLDPNHWCVVSEDENFLIIREKRGSDGMRQILALDKKFLIGLPTLSYKEGRKVA